ncbi:universal stress protein [Crocosphaera sp. UHCC 0190]|uniref:universal stress protein n=1 Tax=Crocosphaera sp. UHCC 0190 TaxID=3110246 RepID=UPI002B20409A|nr:universal stress protein [Crocosphaera sp. UHCC 0190]MEA5511729.1 universal stress protein [Crocosphaera sp. UHCC 0190]
MFENCLICTDFADGLHRLVDFVPQLAINGLKRIVFLHSISVWQGDKAASVDEEKIAEAKKRLAPALEKVPQGVEVKVEVRLGNPKDSILQLIDIYKIDVVFTGMPIHNTLEARIFGSHTLELAPSTPTPLMILRPQLISTYTCEELALRCQHLWRYLLIPYNDGKSAHYLLENIKKMAQEQPNNGFKHCLLFWVIDDGGRNQELTEYHLQEAQEKLNQVKAELETLNLSVKTEVRQGNPLQEILDAALHYDISAIAIACDYRSNILEWTAPSLANDVLNRSWFPVLFFSPKK